MRNFLLIWFAVFFLKAVTLFAGDGIVDFEGEWDFYAGSLLSPVDISNVQPDGKVSLPGTWENAEFNNSSKILGWKGALTLHFHVSVPFEAGESCGLIVPQIGTAYRLFLNGCLIASNGSPALTAKDTHSEILPVTVFFDSPSREWDLLIQTANFSDRMGSLLKPIQAGRASVIMSRKLLRVGEICFIIGVLLIMMVYHVGLFIINRHDFSNLWYAILIFLASLRTLLEGEKFFVFIFPHFPFELSMRLIYFSYYFGLFVFLNFIRSVFSEKFPSRLTRIFIWVILIMNIVALLLPLSWLTATQIIFHIVAVFLSGLVFFVLIRAVKDGVAFSAYYLIGVIFIMIVGLNDILYSQGVINTGYRLHWGIFAFILVQTLALSARFAKIESLPEENENYDKSKGSLELVTESLSKSFGLSQREKEVLKELGYGKTYRQIAEGLFISVRTVKFHIYNIYQKTGVNSRAELFGKMMKTRPD